MILEERSFEELKMAATTAILDIGTKRFDFNKFNYTVTRILHFIYHMTLKSLKNRIFDMKTPMFCHL